MLSRPSLVLCCFCYGFCAASALGQTIYVPGGAVGSSSNGNVGVGTASPSAKLTVVGARQNSLTTGNSIFQLGGDDVFLYGGALSGGSYALMLQVMRNWDGYAFPLSLQPTGGNVGIGTSSPSHKLSVNGAIRAKEVIVDTGWADYVFAADYRLAPLDEVEAHIKSEKRLPGIPSATEVATQGVSVGEMQAKLLAKVEELTLHAIAQEKLLKSLHEENGLLRTRLNSLEFQTAKSR